MKKIVLALVSMIVLLSCDELNSNVEQAFKDVSVKQDSIANTKHVKLAEINKRLDGMHLSEEDTKSKRLVYANTQVFTKTIDSLLQVVDKDNSVANNNIKLCYNKAVLRLNGKLNLVKAYETELKLDTLYQKEDGLKEFPKPAMLAMVSSGKLDGIEKATSMLTAIEDKYKQKDSVPATK